MVTPIPPATAAILTENALPRAAASHEPSPGSEPTLNPEREHLEPRSTAEQPPSSREQAKEQESACAPEADAEAYEQRHVHAVYARIADHFSATRHKPWPLVSSFLAAQQPGSVGLDLGCGNGKYLGVNPDVLLLGSDRSAELAALALTLASERGRGVGASRGKGVGERDDDSGRSRVQVAGKGQAQPQRKGPADEAAVTPTAVRGGAGADVLVADGLDLPFRAGRADFAICIAVLHHFSTRRRRVDAVRAVLETLRTGGQAMLFVWALEQGSSRRGWNEGGEQDLLVPWVILENKKKKKQEKKKTGPNLRSETDVDKKVELEPAEEGSETTGDQTYQRYYHLYCKGELEDEVVEAGGSVLEGGYEKDNWWVIATR